MEFLKAPSRPGGISSFNSLAGVVSMKGGPPRPPIFPGHPGSIGHSRPREGLRLRFSQANFQSSRSMMLNSNTGLCGRSFVPCLSCPAANSKGGRARVSNYIYCIMNSPLRQASCPTYRPCNFGNPARRCVEIPFHHPSQSPYTGNATFPFPNGK